LYTKQGIY